MTSARDVVVVGAGHNGLVAACYLARAGLDVEVVERDSVAGGAVSTVQRWPGVHVDRGSTMHVMVRHTGIVEELDLAGVGLRYVDVDPWAVAHGADAPIRFGVDIEATASSIAASCGTHDADAYVAWVRRWMPRVDAMLASFHRAPSPLGLARAFWPLGRRVGRSGGELAREFLQSADALLDATFDDERLRTALAWWAAQAGPPPHDVGTAPLAATALLMHKRPPGRPVGGSGGLAAALVRRLSALGGVVRLGDAAAAVRNDRVITSSGDEIRCHAVVVATHAVAMLDLVDAADDVVDARARMRTGNGLGIVLRVLTDRPPAFRNDVGDGAGAMHLLARSRNQLRIAHAEFLTGRVPSDPPLLVMCPTTTDGSLAPPGRHVVTVWSQWHPYALRDESWDAIRRRETERLIASVEEWAPDFGTSVLATHLQTPVDLERELALVRGNVMHLDMSLDAMFALRPLPEWSHYRGPHGVYLCGASTHPGGGVSGASGRSAAQTVLRDLRRRGSRRRR